MKEFLDLDGVCNYHAKQVSDSKVCLKIFVEHGANRSEIENSILQSIAIEFPFRTMIELELEAQAS